MVLCNSSANRFMPLYAARDSASVWRLTARSDLRNSFIECMRGDLVPELRASAGWWRRPRGGVPKIGMMAISEPSGPFRLEIPSVGGLRDGRAFGLAAVNAAAILLLEC